jgi:hypothetical protein
LTDDQKFAWYGLAGLVALAGLGALLEGGGRVANPRALGGSALWRPPREEDRGLDDGPDRLPCGHRGPADAYGECPRCAALAEESDE